MSTKHIPRTWLWHDDIILSAESRSLREDHNATVNAHAELEAEVERLKIKSNKANHALHDKDTILQAQVEQLREALENINRVAYGEFTPRNELRSLIDGMYVIARTVLEKTKPIPQSER